LALEVFLLPSGQKLPKKQCWTCVIGSNVTQKFFPSKIFLKLNITHAIGFLILKNHFQEIFTSRAF
jgi:hypothetical protein